MKQRSIRFKIMCWFGAAFVLIALSTYLTVFFASSQIIRKGIQDNLIMTIENNVDEVEFFKEIGALFSTDDVDHFIAYENGFLEIDDDFLDEVNEVHTALYLSDNTLLYGENPISQAVSSLSFADGEIQTVRTDGTLYYIYDRALSAEGLDGLWLRGVVSEEQGDVELAGIIRLSFLFLPLLVVLACGGGYLIARKLLLPVQKISETARQIGQENDLKKRIDIGPGTDELHQLADTFNEMFEKLQTLFEAERQFTSDASHELRTPMSVISAQCEFTLEAPRTPEEYEEALKVIRRQSRRMSRLINDMLEFARLETNAGRYTKETVDMTALVSSLCADMALIQEKQITLGWDAQPDIVLYGNHDLLLRMLSNLISNAYRYGRDNGHIFVQLKKEADEIRISVADDGVGISEEEQKKIFHRFYQSDHARSGDGLGLGLSMANEIAGFHGGRIYVESAVNQGSTFTVLLMRNA